MNQKNINIAIIGVTGYTGQKLTQVLCKHPNVNIKAICSTSIAGETISSFDQKFVAYANRLPDTIIHPDDIDFADIDCLFTATPNGIAMKIAQKALDTNTRIIDLSADFRLKDKEVYEEWYAPLTAPSNEIMEQAVYGLVEWNRSEIKNAKVLANPGCYPTASALSILPLIKDSLINNDSIIIDAKSGITGAGRKASEKLLFAEISESFAAYNVSKHRHTPEIEQSLDLFGGEADVKLRFTPHLLPIMQGILTTIYLKPKSGVGLEQIKESLQKQYANERFVSVVDQLPTTSDVRDTNNCFIYPAIDERTGLVILVSVIDNLMKGAASQAVQNFNIMYDLPEDLALI